MGFLRLAWALFFGFAVASCAVLVPLTNTADDGELHRITHALVTDSLIGGGYRDNENFSALDSTSLALLNLANVPAKLAERGRTLRCPGGAGSKADAQVTYGYWIKVRMEPTPDRRGRILTVYKSCEFVYPGRQPSGFYEGGSWEVQKVSGAWRIVRIIDRVIT